AGRHRRSALQGDRLRGGRQPDFGYRPRGAAARRGERVLRRARVRRARYRPPDARRAAGAQLRRAGTRTAPQRGDGARDRADGERREAGGESAGRRLDRGDARRQFVGALRAHRGGDGGWAVDSDGARSSGSGAQVTGTVAEQLPSALYRVKLEGGAFVTAHIADRMDRNFVRIL